MVHQEYKSYRCTVRQSEGYRQVCFYFIWKTSVVDVLVWIRIQFLTLIRIPFFILIRIHARHWIQTQFRPQEIALKHKCLYWSLKKLPKPFNKFIWIEAGKGKDIAKKVGVRG